MKFWIVKQGTATARVGAESYKEARERAAAIGFKKPESIVLETLVRELISGLNSHRQSPSDGFSC
jgi:hypothetical protein